MKISLRCPVPSLASVMRSLPLCGDWEVESVETPIDLEMVSASAGEAIQLRVVSAPEGR